MGPRKEDIRKTGLVTLEGYQAVLSPGKFGYKLSAVVDDAQVEQLEKDRVPLIEWCTSKLKNPKRSTCKPEPWEEVASNKHKIAFSWSEDARPPVVDTEGTPITILLFRFTADLRYNWRSIKNPIFLRMVLPTVLALNSLVFKLLNWEVKRVFPQLTTLQVRMLLRSLVIRMDSKYPSLLSCLSKRLWILTTTSDGFSIRPGRKGR